MTKAQHDRMRARAGQRYNVNPKEWLDSLVGPAEWLEEIEEDETQHEQVRYETALILDRWACAMEDGKPIPYEQRLAEAEVFLDEHNYVRTGVFDK